MTAFSGHASCHRITIASAPPTMPMSMAVTMYWMPITL
jgi:hypothetical protein